jgi:exodeoxyribonuclease VII large subunit
MRFRVQAHAQRLDELRDGLTRTLTERLTLLHRGMVERQHALLAQGPHRRIQTALVVIPQLYKRLEQEARRGLHVQAASGCVVHDGFGRSQSIGDLKPRV